MRLRPRFDTVQLKDSIAEVVFLNSHDGTSAYDHALELDSLRRRLADDRDGLRRALAVEREALRTIRDLERHYNELHDRLSRR